MISCPLALSGTATLVDRQVGSTCAREQNANVEFRVLFLDQTKPLTHFRAAAASVAKAPLGLYDDVGIAYGEVRLVLCLEGRDGEMKHRPFVLEANSLTRELGCYLFFDFTLERRAQLERWSCHARIAPLRAGLSSPVRDRQYAMKPGKLRLSFWVPHFKFVYSLCEEFSSRCIATASSKGGEPLNASQTNRATL